MRWCACGGVCDCITTLVMAKPVSPPTSETSPAVKAELSSATMLMVAGLPALPAAPATEPASVGVIRRGLCDFGRSFCVPALTLPEGPLVTLTSPATVTDELPRSKTPANRSWLFELAATSPPLPVPLTTSPPRPLASVSEPWMSIELSVSAARKAMAP